MPNRSLTVFVPGWIIEDRSLDPPAVGAVMSTLLDFTRAHPRASRKSIREVTALARPVFGRLPVTYPDGAPRWPTILRGDGWSAAWAADRPMSGYVRLAGTLYAQLDLADMDADQADPVRGLVTRVRLVTHGSEHDRYDDVEVAPSQFDVHGATGVLVDLDLDAVPDPPLRPALIPASISAHGTDVWVLDRDLPVLVRIANATTHPVVTEHSLPAAVLQPSAPIMRRVHADPSGCWVTGADGILRCTPESDGSLSTAQVDTADGRAAAGCGDTLLAFEPARLVRPGVAPVPVALPPGSVQSVTSTGDGFALVVWQPEEQGYRFVTVTTAGTVTPPTPLEFDEAHPFPRFAGSGHLVTRTGLWRIDRAGVEKIHPLAAMPPSCGAAGDVLWLMLDRRHPHHDDAAWPLTRSADIPARSARQFLLVILDRATLDVRATVPCDRTHPELAVTSDDTLWVAGAVLQKIAVDGTVESVDPTALL